MSISRTPFRIYFFGGRTDYPPWYKKYGGAVLPTPFDKYCYITCRELPPFFEHKYRIAYSRVENAKDIGDIEHPAVRALLQGRRVTKEWLTKEAIRIEQEVLQENAGSQGQAAAAHGGFNVIHFQPDGGGRVEPLVLPDPRKQGLNQHLMLLFVARQQPAVRSALNDLIHVPFKFENSGSHVIYSNHEPAVNS